MDGDFIIQVAANASTWGPPWARADMSAAAVEAIVVHLDGGGDVREVEQVAWNATRHALRQEKFLAGPWQSRLAAEDIGLPGVQRGLDRTSPVGVSLLMTSSNIDVADGALDELRRRLVTRGVPGDSFDIAIDVLAEAVSERMPDGPTVRPRMFDVSSSDMAKLSGLSSAVCLLLKRLILGVRPRPEREKPGKAGLLARAANSEDVWSALDVLDLVDAIAIAHDPKFVVGDGDGVGCSGN